MKRFVLLSGRHESWSVSVSLKLPVSSSSPMSSHPPGLCEQGAVANVARHLQSQDLDPLQVFRCPQRKIYLNLPNLRTQTIRYGWMMHLSAMKPSGRRIPT